MRPSLVLSRGRLPVARRVLWGAAGAAFAVACGWALAETGRLGIRTQLLLVTALIVVPLGTYLYVTKPHVVLNAYLFVLPFLLSDAEGGGVKAGEILSLAVAVGGVPVLVLTRGSVRGRARTMVWGFLALAAVGAVSVAVNSVVSLSTVANGVVKYGVFAVIAALLYAFNDDEVKAERLVKTLVLAGIPVALFSIFEYATGRSYFPEYGYSRASGTFEHWNQLGGYMALVSFPTIMYAVRSRRMLPRIAYFAGWTAEIVALLLSLTLGAMVAVAAGAAAGAIFYFRRGILKTLVAVVIGAGVVAVVWQAVPEISDKFEAADQRGQSRFYTYRTGFYAFRDNFWFGVGAQEKVLEAVLESNRRGPSVSSVPHNAFLAIGVEKGVLGPVLLLVIVVAALRTVAPAAATRIPLANRLLVYGIGMGSVAFLTQSMTNLLLLHVRLGIVWIAFHVAATRLAKAPLPRDA